jgi:hypothetical protein
LWLWLALAADEGRAMAPIVVGAGFATVVIVADDRNGSRGPPVDFLLRSCVACNGRLGAAGALALVANGRIWVVCADFWLGIFLQWATLWFGIAVAADGGSSRPPVVSDEGIVAAAIVRNDRQRANGSRDLHVDRLLQSSEHGKLVVFNQPS